MKNRNSYHCIWKRRAVLFNNIFFFDVIIVLFWNCCYAYPIEKEQEKKDDVTANHVKRSQSSRNQYKKGGCQTENPQKFNLPLKMNLNHPKMVSTSFLLLRLWNIQQRRRWMVS